MKNYLYMCGLVLSGQLAISGQGVAATAEENALQLERLTATVNEWQQLTDKLSAFDELNALDLEDLRDEMDDAFKFSGYADVAYVLDSRSGVINHGGGFRLQHLSLQPQKQVTDDVFFFSEIEFENAPFFLGKNDASNSVMNDAKFFVEVMEIDVQLSDDLKVIFGRYFAPAGIWNIDNYPPFTTTQERPQHIRRIFPQVMDGLDFRGRLQLGSSMLHYDFLFGNGESFNTSPVPGNQAFFNGRGDPNGDKSYGLRLALDLPTTYKIRLGATVYTDKYAPSDWKFPNADKLAVGVDVHALVGAFELQAEYAKGRYTGIASSVTYNASNNFTANATKNITGGAAMRRVGYYGQLMYNVGNHSMGYRYDLFNADDRVINNDSTFNSLIYNYHMNEDVVFKVEHHEIKQLDANNMPISYSNTWFTVVTAL